MTGSAPDFLTSEFTKRFNISGQVNRKSQSLQWPEKFLLQNSEDMELIGQ